MAVKLHDYVVTYVTNWKGGLKQSDFEFATINVKAPSKEESIRIAYAQLADYKKKIWTTREITLDLPG